MNKFLSKRVRICCYALLIVACYVFLPTSLDRRSANFADRNQDECSYGDIGDPNGYKDPKSGENLAPKVYPSETPIVKTVELNDSGLFKNRCQYTDVLYETICTKSRAADDPNQSKNGLWKCDHERYQHYSDKKTVILYIHGWKHGSSTRDLESFSFFINQLKEIRESSGDKGQIIGVYVAWNGALNWGALENLSFWNRKRAADQIASSGSVTKLIGSLASTLNLSHNEENELILVGHSFGARILYSSISQPTIFEVETNRSIQEHGIGIYPNFQVLADSTIFLNPAFEASRYSALDSLRRRENGISTEQQPLFLTVSTNNDHATKYAFPLGQWVGLARDKSEEQTIGNFEDFITHKLEKTDTCSSESEGFWYDQYKTTLDNGQKYCLSRLTNKQPGNPFIVASTDKSIVDGHNGIWDRDFMYWLAKYLDASSPK